MTVAFPINNVLNMLFFILGLLHLGICYATVQKKSFSVNNINN